MDELERLAGRLAHGFNRWAPDDSETQDEILENAALVSQLADELLLNSSRLEVNSAPATPPAPEPMTVLVVDGCPESRRALYSMLDEMGWTVLDAQSAEEALVLSKHHAGPIHIMLTDVVMQEMSGRELAERAASRRPEMRVIYMSGYADAEIMYWGLLGPGVATLQKPVTAEALTRSLSEVNEEQFA
jgi:CheY-like chemotaxis protein